MYKRLSDIISESLFNIDRMYNAYITHFIFMRSVLFVLRLLRYRFGGKFTSPNQSLGEA